MNNLNRLISIKHIECEMNRLPANKTPGTDGKHWQILPNINEEKMLMLHKPFLTHFVRTELPWHQNQVK